jgi:hypothetical protein
MTNHACRRVIGQTHSEALLRLVAAVCHGDETRVLTLPHTYTPAVMKAHPGGTAGDACREV